MSQQRTCTFEYLSQAKQTHIAGELVSGGVSGPGLDGNV